MALRRGLETVELRLRKEKQKKSCSAVEWKGKHGTEMSRMTKTWTQENMFRNCSSTIVEF